MTRNDELDGYDALTGRQRAAVDRMSARARRYEQPGYQPTQRDRWDRFNAVEQAEENDQIRRGGGHRP